MDGDKIETYEKKFQELENLLKNALDDNAKLRQQNEEMKKNILTIRQEIAGSFDNIKDVLKKINV
jgi:hypothetical protein